MSGSIRRYPQCALKVAVLFCILGCAWPGSAGAAVPAPPDRWELLRAQDLRVAAVGYRLSVANAAFCPGALAPQAGFVLHSIEQYDPLNWDSVARGFRLGAHVGVMAVVPDSPAQRSGLTADDQLLSVNGRVLSAAIAIPPAAPSRRSVELAQRILVEEMMKGEVILGILRLGAHHDVGFTADRGCASEVEMVTSGEVNAWSDGERVVVSDGLVARCRTDAELALVIGHELAHNLLRHSEELATGGSVNRRLHLTGIGSDASREMEEEADRLAVRIASAASYDLSDALSFVTGLLEAESAVGVAGTHPAAGRRLALLEAEIASADANRASGPEGT